MLSITKKYVYIYIFNITKARVQEKLTLKALLTT